MDSIPSHVILPSNFFVVSLLDSKIFTYKRKSIFSSFSFDSTLLVVNIMVSGTSFQEESGWNGFDPSS